MVRELTADNADIEWTVHLANKKAQWYQFQAALDIPEAADLSVPRRNADKSPADRAQLAIDPGPRSISGESVSGGTGASCSTPAPSRAQPVPLGEIRTDEAGRLLVLGGTGRSASPSNAPIFDPADPDSFNNADGWYDDISDGPVTRHGLDRRPRRSRSTPPGSSVAPPNYAPDIIGWRTLYDLLVDVYIECGWMPMPAAGLVHRRHPAGAAPPLQPAMGERGLRRRCSARAARWTSRTTSFIAQARAMPPQGPSRIRIGELRQIDLQQLPSALSEGERAADMAAPLAVDLRRRLRLVHARRAGQQSGSAVGAARCYLRRWVAGDFVNDLAAARAPAADRWTRCRSPNSRRCSTRRRCTSASPTPSIPAAS